MLPRVNPLPCFKTQLLALPHVPQAEVSKLSVLFLLKNLSQHLGKQLRLGLFVAQTDEQSAWSVQKQ